LDPDDFKLGHYRRFARQQGVPDDDRGMSQNTIVWTDIPVTDLGRAAAFYSKVLNALVRVEKMGDFEFGVLPHAEKNVSGCIVVASDNKPSRTGPLLYLSVNGRLDEAVRVVAANGGEVLQPKHPIGPYGFRAIIVDSEGNRIALHSETA
jgi:predicted enzyme related to lactoylglutathione lyase